MWLYVVGVGGGVKLIESSFAWLVGLTAAMIQQEQDNAAVKRNAQKLCIFASENKNNDCSNAFVA